MFTMIRKTYICGSIMSMNSWWIWLENIHWIDELLCSLMLYSPWLKLRYIFVFCFIICSYLNKKSSSSQGAYAIRRIDEMEVQLLQVNIRDLSKAYYKGKMLWNVCKLSCILYFTESCKYFFHPPKSIKYDFLTV